MTIFLPFGSDESYISTTKPCDVFDCDVDVEVDDDDDYGSS